MLYYVDMTLGKRIKAARERLRPKLTQKMLAEHFGISDKAVSAWERDETAPDADKLPALRVILKVSYEWLLEASESPAGDDDISAQMQHLSTAEKAAVRAMVNSFLTQRSPASKRRA